MNLHAAHESCGACSYADMLAPSAGRNDVPACASLLSPLPITKDAARDSAMILPSDASPDVTRGDSAAALTLDCASRSYAQAVNHAMRGPQLIAESQLMLECDATLHFDVATLLFDMLRFRGWWAALVRMRCSGRGAAAELCTANKRVAALHLYGQHEWARIVMQVRKWSERGN